MQTITIPLELAEQLEILASSFVNTYGTHAYETGCDNYPTDGAVLDALRKVLD